MRTVYESHQILQQALKDDIIMGWQGHALFDPPRRYQMSLRLLDGLYWDFTGGSVQDAYHQASDYCLAAQKQRKLKAPMDGMTIQQAYDYFMSRAILRTTEKNMNDHAEQYLHLRRFKRDGARGLPIVMAWAKGGITLCYIKEGPWYKVGAAFCSAQDDYVEVVGEMLAKERLLTSPMYIHEYDWKGDVARRLTCPQGRQWYEHAVKQGYPEKWKLKEYKETWLKVTAPITVGPILWGWYGNTAEGKFQRAGSAKL